GPGEPHGACLGHPDRRAATRLVADDIHGPEQEGSRGGHLPGPRERGELRPLPGVLGGGSAERRVPAPLTVWSAAKSRAVKGHEFGLDLFPEDRAALIAFLKTL